MYLTGRTSQFATGGLDNFLPGATQSSSTERILSGLLAHDGPQYATDAELWNAVADALVAVQRKLTRSAAPAPVGSVAAVGVNPDTGDVYLADSVHNKVTSFSSDGEMQTVYQAPTVPGASDVSVNLFSQVVYVVNPNNNSVDVFAPWGVMTSRLKPSSSFKPLAVAHHKDGSNYDYLYVINNYDGQRKVEVYDAATFQLKGTIKTMGIRIRQGADGMIYLLCNDASIYRIDGLTATKLPNVPVRNSYVDLTSDIVGWVWVLDRDAKIIRIFDADGNEQNPLSSIGTSWELQNPTGIAGDYNFVFYITDQAGIVKQVDIGGNLIDEFAVDTYYPESIPGSCMITGPLAQPLPSYDSVVYPSKTGPDRWKKLIMSSNPADGSNKFTGSPHITSRDVNIEFVVNPGEIVWPSDVRISIRGTGGYAKGYFKKIPNGTTEGKFVTTQADGTLRLRYIFTLCELGPALSLNPSVIYGLSGVYTVDALGYISPL